MHNISSNKCIFTRFWKLHTCFNFHTTLLKYTHKYIQYVQANTSLQGSGSDIYISVSTKHIQEVQNIHLRCQNKYIFTRLRKWHVPTSFHTIHPRCKLSEFQYWTYNQYSSNHNFPTAFLHHSEQAQPLHHSVFSPSFFRHSTMQYSDIPPFHGQRTGMEEYVCVFDYNTLIWKLIKTDTQKMLICSLTAITLVRIQLYFQRPKLESDVIKG